MNRSVLLITPYFAPQSHAAMFRVHKLAKYLPRYGWKPVVLTTDTNYLYNENEALLDELPSEVEIHRARYVEPTLRGVRMALGGEDRSFTALKRQGRLPVLSLEEQAGDEGQTPWVRRVYRHFLKRVAQRPDPYWTWRRPALGVARRLIRQRHIPVVYTTSPPFTVLQMGNSLRKELGCRWVMDLRDPLSYSYRNSAAGGRSYLHQREIEYSSLLGADQITTASSVFGLIYRDLYGIDVSHRTRFIPTGLDEELVPKAAMSGKCEQGHLMFVGEYLTDYGEGFWRILKAALGLKPSLDDYLSVSIVGHETINRARITPHLERYGLSEYVSFFDHMPQKELYRRLATVHGALLLPGETTHWWTLFAKLVDYIALQKPVVALVPDPSEARKQLTRTGLGVFLDGSLTERANKLAAFLTGDGQVQPDAVEIERFLASSQVRAFAKLFDELAEGM